MTGGDTYVPPVSTPEQAAEAAAFLVEQKAAESPAQKQRANKVHGAVFSLMQYRQHPDTGEVLLTQEQIDAGMAKLDEDGFGYLFADIWHGQDQYTEAEVIEATKRRRDVPPVGTPKGLHWHAALWLPGADRSVRQVANAFGLPAGRVRVPREMSGRKPRRSPYAAEDAFYDFCEYLTHEDARSAAEGKHRYPDEAVRANFDFRADLDKNRPCAAERRSRGGGGGGGMKERVAALRRAVGTGAMSLDEARDSDFDAWAEDLPRLERLRADYDERTGKVAAAKVGDVWQKSLVVITGPTRNGKDLLAEGIAHELVRIAGLAGQTWQYVKPAGRNSLEGVGRAQVIHHEDMRFRLLPDYDEALRYFDPNQAVAASGRHRNRGTPTPRAILATSSETLLSLGYSLKRRLDTDVSVERTAVAEAKSFPLDIDEFLYRIGWYVDVLKPPGAVTKDEVLAGAIASIYRVHEGTEPHRTEAVKDRAGNRVGSVRTQHRLEPVAAIRGLVDAARFLAVSIIEERSPDVVDAVPAEAMAELTAPRVAVETAFSADDFLAEAADAARDEAARLALRDSSFESAKLHAFADQVRNGRLPARDWADVAALARAAGLDENAALWACWEAPMMERFGGPPPNHAALQPHTS